MGIGSSAAGKAGTKLAPQVAASYVRNVLDHAIDGIGPIRSAIVSADSKLVAADGDIESAVRALIKQHTKLAGVEGLVTNIGGLTTLAVSVPANVTGLALIQCHLVAGIVYLRGYDLEDPRVRNAILTCMMGSDTVEDLVKRKKLPSTPMALATSPVHDPVLDKRISSEVTAELVGKIAGRRAATLIGRRIPLLGGAVGASTDAYATWQIGKYAAEEMRDRRLRS